MGSSVTVPPSRTLDGLVDKMSNHSEDMPPPLASFLSPRGFISPRGGVKVQPPVLAQPTIPKVQYTAGSTTPSTMHRSESPAVPQQLLTAIPQGVTMSTSAEAPPA